MSVSNSRLVCVAEVNLMLLAFFVQVKNLFYETSSPFSSSDDIGGCSSGEARDRPSSQAASSSAQSGRSSHRPGSHYSLACCLSRRNSWAAAGKGKQPPTQVRPSGSKWFPPHEDLAHPTQCRGTNQNTRPSEDYSSCRHLPVWSRIICHTPAAVSSVLLGTLVIVLQPAWRMWDVMEGKTIATSFAQIIWGLLYVRASIVCSVSVKQQPAWGGKRAGGWNPGEWEEGEELKTRLAMLGKCFCDPTMRFKTGWKWSPRLPAPSPLLLRLWKSYSEDFKGRFLERHHV